MGSQLHQTLRNFCLGTGWNYAVFWKLKYRAGTLLVCEDAYYDNNDYQQPSFPLSSASNLHCQHLPNDPLGLAVAEMSYQVYSLGEGVVGQVAFTGKHLWIATGKCRTDSSSSFQCFEEWQSQYLTGIKTIAVVAVVPHGVVQLGSLDEIPEDLRIVNNVREAIFQLQDTLLASQALTALPSRVESSCLSDISTRTLISGAHHGFGHNAEPINTYGVDFGSATCSYIQNDDHHSHNCLLRGGYENEVIKISKCEVPGMVKLGAIDNLRPLISGGECMEKRKDEQSEEASDLKGKISCLKYLGQSSKNMSTTSSQINGSNSTLDDSVLHFENSRMPSSYHSSDILDSITCDNDGEMLGVPEPSNVHLHNDLANVNEAAYMFCTGYELSEALGPAFRKQNAHPKWGSGDTETNKAAGLSEEMGPGSLLTENSGTEHLLEAVVANLNKNEVDKKNYSIVKAGFSLNRENMSETCTSVGSLSSAGYSLDRETFNSLNSSGSFGVRYSKGFSPTSCSRGRENLGRPQESGKVHKKRARPGESCRPRPRDRQLIQDRIKELRELVPNGSKCSIDSLLERTIKHMIFMQTMIKQAEKLSQCIKPKMLGKEPHLEGTSCTDQGSSWAVEVDNLKASPIIVENVNMNGQMLVEMVCDDGSHFLEISEAIRSMGLAILEGVTESHDEKTWIRFLVEGQTNRSLRRMDILWSLIQLLQTKMATVVG